MELERITVRLRQRNGWEAMDLGLRLAIQHAGAVWGAWWAVTLPVTLVVWGACWSNPGVALLILWWIKPVADRFVLHVLAQAIFDEVPSVARTLGAWRQILRCGLWAALLWRRWDPARAFHQPIAQLEQQTGRAAAQRRRALGRNAWVQAVWLSFVCRLFVVALFAGIAVLIVIFMPEGMQDDNAPGGLWEGLSNWSWADNLTSYALLSLTEPFYVAAGFALYLNRRVQIEGWDVELALRGINARVAALARGGLPALLLGCCLALPLLTVPSALQAEEALGEQTQQEAKDPAREIKAVLAGPDFGSTRDVGSWRYIPDQEREQSRANLGWLKRWFDLVAHASQFIAWAATAIALIALLRFALLTWGRDARTQPQGWRAPEVLFGLAIAPQSLPDDLPAAARALAVTGDVRGALSLLYRGTLSQLVHRHELRLSEGDTEHDTLRRAAMVLGSDASALFARLVQAWQLAAYAARPIPPDTAVQLCNDWAVQFGASGPGGTP
jgi:hypothetical protein